MSTETALVMTYEEVAALLRCSPRTVQKMVSDKKLHRVPKIPGAKILRSEVMALLGEPVVEQVRQKTRVIEQHI